MALFCIHKYHTRKRSCAAAEASLRKMENEIIAYRASQERKVSDKRSTFVFVFCFAYVGLLILGTFLLKIVVVGVVVVVRCHNTTVRQENLENGANEKRRYRSQYNQN